MCQVSTALGISVHSDQQTTPTVALCFMVTEVGAQYGSYKN